MSLDTTVLFSTEKPVFDIHDKWLGHGNYSFLIKQFTSNSTIIGIIKNITEENTYEFKYFTFIKLMAKAQSRLARRINLPLDITAYPSPSNSPADCPREFSSPRSTHRLSPTNYVQCIICFDKCATRIECGHYFHKKCISEWKQESNTCPVCRKEVNEYL